MIQLNKIGRVFQVGNQAVHALRDIDLTIADGEYISIMGPSGSGKSTLLNILGLLDRPTQGRYRLNGNDTTQLSDTELARARREHIGFVFQFFHLIPRLTAHANVELPLVLAGIDREERKERVDKMLSAMGMTTRSHHRPEQLSGGQRQRIAIARAAIMHPQLLLADEPTGNLDTASGNEVLEILESMHQQGITLIVVTHDQDIGDRTKRHIRIVDGKIASDTSDP